MHIPILDINCPLHYHLHIHNNIMQTHPILKCDICHYETLFHWWAVSFSHAQKSQSKIDEKHVPFIRKLYKYTCAWSILHSTVGLLTTTFTMKNIYHCCTGSKESKR